MSRRALAVATAGALVSLLLGCSDKPAHDPAGGLTSTPAPSSPGSAGGPSAGESATGTPAPTDPGNALPPVRHRVSLPALMREEVRAGRVRRTEPLATTERWRSWAVTYTVDGATVSGELLVPTGEGPFPAVVLNHGYIDPAVYTLGRGLSREQEWLAAAGFVVLHTDYRGHAASDSIGAVERESRLAYTRDAIGAVRALEQEPYVDGDRLAMLGRSMGGGVTYNALVAEPGLVDAAVVFAPVSSDFLDNVRQFALPSRPEEVARYYRRFGTPDEAPDFYRELSPRTYFERITEPVLILHGTADDTCPPSWSAETHRLLRRAGVRSELARYPGEGHAFGPRFEDAMRRTVAFLRRHLDV